MNIVANLHWSGGRAGMTTDEHWKLVCLSANVRAAQRSTSNLSLNRKGVLNMKVTNICCLALLCGLLWLVPTDVRAQGEDEMTPEMKEVKAAVMEKDPAKKLDALAAYLKKHPNSPIGDDLRSLYIGTL